jgi:hypothetical protein
MVLVIVDLSKRGDEMYPQQKRRCLSATVTQRNATTRRKKRQPHPRRV